jgi:uncharacterized phage-associated protein
MERTSFKLDLRPRWVTGLVENVREYFSRQDGVEYPPDVIEKSLSEWLEQRVDQMLEGVGDSLTSPHLAEARDFRRILEANARSSIHAAQPVSAARVEAVASGEADVGRLSARAAATIFTGRREFDRSRLGAMVAYVVAKGHDIYKTNLNKLLFYSDMTAYALHGRGISGATYVNMPFGPVPEHIEAVIDALVSSGSLIRSEVPEVGKNAVRFELTGEGAAAELSEEDKRVLDWVLSTYGEMGAGELSELSHKERAYKDTRPLEPIAYEYAKFLKRLPKDVNN